MSTAGAPPGSSGPSAGVSARHSATPNSILCPKGLLSPFQGDRNSLAPNENSAVMQQSELASVFRSPRSPARA